MAQAQFSVAVKTRLAPETKARLLEIAARDEVGIADVVRRALREFVKKEKGTAGKPASR